MVSDAQRRSGRKRRAPSRFGEGPRPERTGGVEPVDVGTQTVGKWYDEHAYSLLIDRESELKQELRKVLVRLTEHCAALASSEQLRAEAERARVKLLLEIERLTP